MARIWVILLVVGSLAFSDEVKLKSGGKIEGLVSEDGVRVYVETGFGDVEVAADQVDTINYDHEAPIEQFYKRWEKIRGSTKAEDFCELARWCEANRCTKFVKMLTGRRDKLEPDHSCGATVVKVEEKPAPRAQDLPSAKEPPKKAPPRKTAKKPKEKVWVMRETIMVGIHPGGRRLNVSAPPNNNNQGRQSPFGQFGGWNLPTFGQGGWLPTQAPNQWFPTAGGGR